MISFREFSSFEIWPTRRGREGEIRWKGQVIGRVKQYGFDSYALTLKGIRFKHGKTTFAPGAEGKHFKSTDSLEQYLLSEECIATIQEAYSRRAEYHAVSAELCQKSE